MADVHTKKMFVIRLTLAPFHTWKSAKVRNLKYCLLDFKFSISKSTAVKQPLYRNEQKEEKTNI